MPATPESAKLSLLQRATLRRIYRETVRIERHGTEHERAMLRVWGIPWDTEAHKMTRSGSACLSRSLARLEERGLVQRKNHVNGEGRTTDVILTPAGYELAKRQNG